LELRRDSQGGLLSDLRRFIHCKKKVNTFLFPAKESLVSCIPAGDGKSLKKNLQCNVAPAPSSASATLKFCGRSADLTKEMGHQWQGDDYILIFIYREANLDTHIHLGMLNYNNKNFEISQG
jgi:hypothetical protein